MAQIEELVDWWLFYFNFVINLYHEKIALSANFNVRHSV